MCFAVYQQSHVAKLCLAALQVQTIINDGTLASAFKSHPEHMQEAVGCFDLLEEAVAVVTDAHKDVSPFLRYRKEILGQYEMSKKLRELVLSLWGNQPCRLGSLFHEADQHHTKIALECVASYSLQGERDSHFMDLAAEIAGLERSVSPL